MPHTLASLSEIFYSVLRHDKSDRQPPPLGAQVSATSLNRLPVWDSQTCPLKSPVLLFEGAKAMLVEEDDICTRVNGGRSIFAERLGSLMIRSDPKSVNGKTIYVRRSIKAFRRKSQPPGLRGQSSKMTPGRTTDGNVGTSAYGLLLDAFVSEQEKASQGKPGRATVLFGSRNILRYTSDTVGVSTELLAEPHQGSILYFPHAGRIGAAYKGTRNFKTGEIEFTPKTDASPEQQATESAVTDVKS